MSHRLDIDNPTFEAITSHAERVWPEECCGVLIGRKEGQAIRITGCRQSANVSDGDRRRRYVLDPGVLVRALLESRRSADQVVGFYHSHPDGGARPSERDREDLWPGTVYVIVGVEGGRSGSVRAWMRNDPGLNCSELSLFPRNPTRTEGRPAASKPV